MTVEMKSIGVVRTTSETVPRHWTVSNLAGTLEIEPEYLEGLKDIRAGDRIVVLFCFDRSPKFTPEYLVQTPPHRQGERVGVFSICSPVRPNPIGLSVFEVLGVEENRVRVKGVDTFDGTPILDIKPFMTGAQE